MSFTDLFGVATIVSMICDLVMVYLAIQTYRGGNMESLNNPLMEKRLKRRSLIIGSLLLLTLGSIGYDVYDRRHSQSGEWLSRLLIEWGGTKTSCWVTLNSSEMLEFKFSGQYKAATVCGFEDTFVDRFDSKMISVSAPFRIVPGQMTITVTMREEMAKLMAENPRRMMWIMPILIPDGVETAVIHQLSDVEKYGGKILAPAYFKEDGNK